MLKNMPMQTIVWKFRKDFEMIAPSELTHKDIG